MGCNCGGSAQGQRRVAGAPQQQPSAQPNPQAGADDYYWTGPKRQPEKAAEPAPAK